MARFLFSEDERRILDQEVAEQSRRDAFECLSHVASPSDGRIHTWSTRQLLPIHHPDAFPLDRDGILERFRDGSQDLEMPLSPPPVPSLSSSSSKGKRQADSISSSFSALTLHTPPEPAPLQPHEIPVAHLHFLGKLSALLWRIARKDDPAGNFNELFVRYCANLCQLFLARIVSSDTFLPVSNPRPSETGDVHLSRQQKWQLRLSLLPSLLGWPVRDMRLGSLPSEVGADIAIDISITSLDDFTNPTGSCREFIHRLLFRGPSFSQDCSPETLWTAMMQTGTLSGWKDDMYLSIDRVPSPVTPWTVGIDDFQLVWQIQPSHPQKKRLAERYSRVSLLLVRILMTGLQVPSCLLQEEDVRHHLDFHTKVAQFFAANASRRIFENHSRRTEAIQNLYMHALCDTWVHFLSPNLDQHFKPLRLDPVTERDTLQKIAKETASVLREFQFPGLQRYNLTVMPRVTMMPGNQTEVRRIHIGIHNAIHRDGYDLDFLQLEIPLEETSIHSHLNIRGNISRIIELCIRASATAIGFGASSPPPPRVAAPSSLSPPTLPQANGKASKKK